MDKLAPIPELLPCPFCAGESSLRNGGPGCKFIQCDSCNATSDDGSTERVVAAWNRRDVFDATERTLDRLETIVAPDNGTTDEVLSAVLACANAWVPEARIVGNVRAGDISRVLSALLSERERRTAQGVTVPAGWALVPIEPTEAMMNAGLYQSGHDAEWADVYSAWRDMVAFAPSLSTSAGGGGMRDIVERLKELAPHPVWTEAAAEIQRLRAEVEELSRSRDEWLAAAVEQRKKAERLERERDEARHNHMGALHAAEAEAMERAAQIAERYDPDYWGNGHTARLAQNDIAAAIRAEASKKGGDT